MPNQVETVIFFGMIASGKSTLAQAFASARGLPYYNSDVVRKELAGELAAGGRGAEFGGGIYTPEFSRKTYDALLERAGQELAQARSVVLDGSYQSRAERGRVLELAEANGAEARFVLCTCPEPLMKKRMEIRAKDPDAVSDGRWEIYLKQKERFEQPDELRAPGRLVRINTDDTVPNLLRALEAMLNQHTNKR